MSGRDHSIQCPDCLEWYSGFNGPDECLCPLIKERLAALKAGGDYQRLTFEQVLAGMRRGEELAERFGWP